MLHGPSDLETIHGLKRGVETIHWPKKGVEIIHFWGKIGSKFNIWVETIHFAPQTKGSKHEMS